MSNIQKSVDEREKENRHEQYGIATKEIKTRWTRRNGVLSVYQCAKFIGA